MKTIVLFIFLALGMNANSQAFSFQDTTTTIVKTTDQSPAHWYLEIYNDVLVDTTLRWKASFDLNLPAQWVITLDDQDNFHDSINDGDSSDFTLFAPPAFPQKLIIGAILNNTPGAASVYFDIYDPEDPNFVQTIQYRFIISMGSGTWGTEELNNENKWFEQSGRTFVFPEEFDRNNIELYSLSGKRVCSTKIAHNKLEFASDIQSGTYFLTMKSDNTLYSTRILL